MSMPEEIITAFVDKHLELLQNERDSEIEQNNLMLSNCAPKLLEQKGLALLNLSVVSIEVGLGGRSLIELERPLAYNTSSAFPPHTFRPGDLGRIEGQSTSSNAPRNKKKTTAKTSANGSNDPQFVEGVVYKVTDSRIVIAVDSQKKESGDIDLPERCRLVKLANNVTYDRLEKTLKSLREAAIPDKNSCENRGLHLETLKLLQCLLGLSQLSTISDVSGLNFYDTTLNASQRKAIGFALGSKEVACIHGPPGTGKTHTLIEILRQLLHPRGSDLPSDLRPAKKVLVCGASNLSVDNILERLLLPPPPGAIQLKCTRIGHPARIRGNSNVLDATLDAQSTRSEQAELLRDVKTELTNSLSLLSGTARGQKGKRPRGDERRKLWDEVKELRREYRKREKGVVTTVLKEAEVVLATCHSAGGRVLDNAEFDVVIIDEATQALEAACWIPILKAKKLILAGDPMQLPPTVLAKPDHISKKSSLKPAKTKSQPKDSKTAKPEPVIVNSSSGEDSASEPPEDEMSGPEKMPMPKSKGKTSKKAVVYPRTIRVPQTLETTMFERLEWMYGPSIKRMLEVQYRMHEKICEFPSKTLYRSKVRSDSSVAHHLLRDLENIDGALSAEGSGEFLSTPIVFFDTAGCEYFEKSSEASDEGSKCNENEAVLVKHWIGKLVASGVLPSQIAVITPYQAQVTLISSLLSPLYASELEVGTVDGMQGREKEAIVITLVRSNDKREVGFLKDKRRLNVAMTRARRHMCVIGDSSTVQHGSQYLKKWMTWLEEKADVYYGGLDAA